MIMLFRVRICGVRDLRRRILNGLCRFSDGLTDCIRSIFSRIRSLLRDIRGSFLRFFSSLLRNQHMRGFLVRGDPFLL